VLKRAKTGPNPDPKHDSCAELEAGDSLLDSEYKILPIVAARAQSASQGGESPSWPPPTPLPRPNMAIEQFLNPLQSR
jgi:hypothetical protein